jgi:hypothetical protein
MKAQLNKSNVQPSTIEAHLDHLQILSPDPRGLAEFYDRCFGMTLNPMQDQWFCQGPQRSLLITPGARGTLGFAAFAVSDASMLTALIQRLGAANIPVQRSTTPLFESSSVGFYDPDGHLVFWRRFTAGQIATPRFSKYQR